MTREEVEKIVKFVRDHQIRFTWKGTPDFKEGDYERSTYDRRSELLPKSKAYHDEENQWWIDQYMKHDQTSF